jgi:outer membrane protein OmpA-like peptidoglycan-associated protein
MNNIVDRGWTIDMFFLRNRHIHLAVHRLAGYFVALCLVVPAIAVAQEPAPMEGTTADDAGQQNDPARKITPVLSRGMTEAFDNPADAKPSGPETAAEEKKLDVPPVESEHLACGEAALEQPHVKIMAKVKEGDQYGTTQLGCILFPEGDQLLNETTTQALDDTVDYLLGLDNVIRIYIDLPADQPTTEDEVRLSRQRAFVVKKYLVNKGVFSHLKQIRKGEFVSREKEPLPPQKKETKVAKKPAPPKPKPRDPSRDYAHVIEHDQVMFMDPDPTLYGNDTRAGAFQFIPLESVYFPTNGDQLTNRARSTLNATADYILDHAETERLIIQGHTDYVASYQYNYRLSDRRSIAVQRYLMEKGVPESLIEIVSKGETQPVDENWTRPGRARNRRVELYLVQRLPESTVEADTRATP